MLDTSQFLARVDMEPAFFDKMRDYYDSVIASEHGAQTEACHAAARNARRTLFHRRSLVRTKAALDEMDQLLEQSVGDPGSPLRQRVALLLNEARDWSLDIAEPMRSLYTPLISSYMEDFGQIP